MNKRVTSVDIAKIAGVSQATVSLVLNGKSGGRVSPEIAEKIKKLAKENNYMVNKAARTLRTGSAKHIALVVPDSENPFYGRILHNLTKPVIDQGYCRILIETDNTDSWYRYIENAILGNEIDVAIVCYTDILGRNPEMEKRIISINDSFYQMNSISLDFESSVEQAVGLFKEKGYRQVIHVKPTKDKETFNNRSNAYYRGCNRYGYLPSEIEVDDLTYNDLFEKLERVHSSLIYPTAFILDDDLLASGVYNFAAKNNLKIGKDIGVIALDDTYICRNYYPKLSSFGFEIPILVSKIFDMIDNIHEGKDIEHFQISLSLNDGASF